MKRKSELHIGHLTHKFVKSNLFQYHGHIKHFYDNLSNHNTKDWYKFKPKDTYNIEKLLKAWLKL